VALPDFPGQHWRTHGDTYEEAVANGKEALESLIVSYEADGEPLRGMATIREFYSHIPLKPLFR
jgi:predicted RNase H-like HicB family nuclease